MSDTSTALKTGKWDESEANGASEDYQSLIADGVSSVEAVEQVAKTLGRSKRSVQGKLTTMGVYVVPEKKPAAKKDDGPTKGEILKELAALNFNIEGLDSATKPAISRVRDFVASARSSD